MGYMDTQNTPDRLVAMRRLWNLTPQQAKFFELLLTKPDVQIEDAIKHVSLGSKKHVHVLLSHIRKKMESVVEIKNAWGSGYWIDAKDREALLRSLRIENLEISDAENSIGNHSPAAGEVRS